MEYLKITQFSVLLVNKDELDLYLKLYLHSRSITRVIIYKILCTNQTRCVNILYFTRTELYANFCGGTSFKFNKLQGYSSN